MASEFYPKSNNSCSKKRKDDVIVTKRKDQNADYQHNKREKMLPPIFHDYTKRRDLCAAGKFKKHTQ